MTKIALKWGGLELEFEGSEEFLRKELLAFVKEVGSLQDSPINKAAANTRKPGGGGSGSESVSTIAQKLSVKRGPELIIAAALSFHTAGTHSFTKRHLRDRIKEASAFYKSTYRNNFDNYVARLVKKGKLSHLGGENYALPATELPSLEQRLKSGAV
jgi:hypothetical protein